MNILIIEDNKKVAQSLQKRLEILAILRGKQDKTPVLILAAKDAIEDRAVGLDAGADDYLIKQLDRIGKP